MLVEARLLLVEERRWRSLSDVIRLVMMSWGVVEVVSGVGCQFGNWHHLAVMILKAGRVELLESGVDRRQSVLRDERETRRVFVVVDGSLERRDGRREVVLERLHRLISWGRCWRVREGEDRRRGRRMGGVMLDVDRSWLLMRVLMRQHDEGSER